MSFFQFPQSYQQNDNQNPIMKKSTFHKVSFNPVISQYKPMPSPMSSQHYIFPSDSQNKQSLFSPITPKQFIFPKNTQSTKSINRLASRDFGNIISPQKKRNQENIIS